MMSVPRDISLLEKIPALSAWKIMSDTIMFIHDSGRLDQALERLANMVQTPEYLDVFAFSPSNLPYDEYKVLHQKHQEFTMWVLGHYFSFSSQAKQSDVQKSIIDLQIKLLHLKQHLAEMIPEYANVLQQLTDYVRSNYQGTLQVKAFLFNIPNDLKEILNLEPMQMQVTNSMSCTKMLKVIMQIFESTIADILHINENTDMCRGIMQNLLFYLMYGNFNFKIAVLKIYVQCIQFNMLHTPFIEAIKEQMFSIFEILFRQKAFEDLGELAQIAFNIFAVFKETDKCQKIYEFILGHDALPQKFKQIALKYTKVVKFDSSLNYLESFKDVIVNEIREGGLSLSYKQVHQALCMQLQALENNVAHAGVCKLDYILEKIEEFLKICMCIKYETEYVLFDEEFLNVLIDSVALHLKHCHCDLNLDMFLNVFSIAIAMGNMKYSRMIFQWLTLLFTQKNSNASEEHGHNAQIIFAHFKSKQFSKAKMFNAWCYYMVALSLSADDIYNEFENYFLRVAATTMENSQLECQDVLARYLPYLMAKTHKVEEYNTKLLVPALQCEYIQVQKELAAILPQLFTILCVDFDTFISFRERNLRINFYEQYKNVGIELGKTNNNYLHTHRERLIEDPNSNVVLTVAKATIRMLKLENTNSDNECRILAIKSLPFMSKFMKKFPLISISKWMEPISSKDVVVQNALINVINEILKSPLTLNSLTTLEKQTFLTRFFDCLFDLIDKSLRYKQRLYMQNALLSMVEKTSELTVELEMVESHFLKHVFYFILMVSSNVRPKACTALIRYGHKLNLNPNDIFSKYKPELCNIIVKVCVINVLVANMKLSASLDNISKQLGYTDSKHFLIEEIKHFLPHFVSLYKQHREVERLIEEIACYHEMTLKDLLADKYGFIYVHLTLNEAETESETSLRFLETKCTDSGATLRRNNFMIILNELLLHFFEKQERVLARLSVLAREDVGPQASIVEYLQPRLLGVLQYFELKMLSKYHNKEKLLLSLAGLFEYMGAKFVTPLRFKIIAMLRNVLTQTETSHPEMNCKVWEAFIYSCDLEILGPQLATIAVSMYSLIKTNESEINKILSHLVVYNESLFKDNIIDLFFLLDFNIDMSIKLKIGQYMDQLKEMTFKEHLKRFMKYLTYETLEVQIHALKYIKNLLKSNRHELDTMILGYNGIDACLVELINYLLPGCRESDQKLRLACGDVIGELGAIEPSHLPPPRGVQDEDEFNFCINEPLFILNSLNVFARAMQVEANCQNTDAFALAIQETLKTYGIGPHAKENNIWSKLSDAQKEFMLPFLSSKYFNVPNLENVVSGPIYGSNLGANFKVWLYIWTSKLISSLKSDKKALFIAYIPSMKQDVKTLMYFLPHIFLNGLLESNEMQQQAHAEFMAVIEPKTGFLTNENIENNRPIRKEHFKIMHEKAESHTSQRENYLKVVFVLFDFLERWLREWIWVNGYAGQENSDYQKIKSFTRKFSKYQLAKSNFEFGGYPRALMYLEDHIMDHGENEDEYLSLLSELYYRLDEPDGVAGVTALRKNEPSFEQRILDHGVSDDASLAVACYERLPFTFPHLKGLLKSHLSLDNVKTSLCIANYGWSHLPSENECNWMLEAQAELLWRLGEWDELDAFLNGQIQDKNTTNWGVNAGRALLSFRSGDRYAFKRQVEMMKMVEVEALGASSLEEGTYQHGYYYIARLHAIRELEQIEECVHELLLRPNDSNVALVHINKMEDEWNMRLQCVQQVVKVIEPILCLRRAALQIARSQTQDKAKTLFGSILGELWLKSAVLAMNSECEKEAYSYLLQAEEFAPPRLFIEKAKWFWKCNEHEKAIGTLERELRVLLPNNRIPDEKFPLSQRKICAEAKLYIASYNDALSNVDVDVNIQHYKESMEMFRDCEKNLVHLAQFYDRVFQTMSDDDRDVKGSDIQIHMINYFGKSLQFGTEFIYQSMPRLLSIWFDYGTRLLDASADVREDRKQNLLKMTKLIDNFLERLPSYIFLTAFSQIISRICHPQREVYKELNVIIVKLLLKYPQQTLWMMISVIKSSYALRSKRCSEILSDPRLKTPVMTKFLNDFIQLAEKLIELTNKNPHLNVGATSISGVLPALHRLLRLENFSEIMIPTYKFRKLILPNQENLNQAYNPFPNHYVYIVSMEDEMTVFPSLQRPRRVTFRGSDGKRYIQLLKPRDDLRKDFRLMEFNDIVNQLLAKEDESRARRLNIRLYSVIALNEECGMIEWVSNLVGLRPALNTIYKQRGWGMKGRELKEKCAKQTDTLEKKRQIYNNILLARHPPVLGEWFRRTFPNAHGWLTARTAYIRTTAVMSMVGHILGLGDRHGENILLDSTCGDVMHVDFNCLFNKGEQFDWPERVPFRLTPNMVAAMGPLGVEGLFRKSCACTLHVLRKHADTLMSIVTPFVYDPLVSWPKRSTSLNNASAEKTNELAVEHIKVIQRRLKGINSRSYSIPLSVEGQTNKLIADAMSVDNLCQMYIGWGAYL